MLYWILKRIILGPILNVLFRPEVEGIEHIPKEGPAILASNHLSVPDTIFMPVAVPRQGNDHETAEIVPINDEDDGDDIIPVLPRR